MKCLLLVVFTEENVADSCLNSCVVGNFSQKNLVPFKCLLSATNDFIDVGDLVDSLWNDDNGLNLLESLQCFNEEVQLLVDKA